MVTAVEARRTLRGSASAVLVGAVTVTAYLAIVLGVVCAVQAVQGHLTPDVPVRLTVAAPAWEEVTLPCVEGWSLDGGGCGPAASPEEWRAGATLPVRHTGSMVADIRELDLPTALLASAPFWAGLIAGGSVALVLVPAVRSTASGRPFAAGNARRFGVAASVVTLGWLAATIGPVLAAPSVIRAIEAAPRYAESGAFAMPAGWLAPDLRLSWWPLLVGVLLVTIAGALRGGARLAADTEGLV